MYYRTDDAKSVIVSEQTSSCKKKRLVHSGYAFIATISGESHGLCNGKKQVGNNKNLRIFYPGSYQIEIESKPGTVIQTIYIEKSLCEQAFVALNIDSHLVHQISTINLENNLKQAFFDVVESIKHPKCFQSSGLDTTYHFLDEFCQVASAYQVMEQPLTAENYVLSNTKDYQQMLRVAQIKEFLDHGLSVLESVRKANIEVEDQKQINRWFLES